MDTKKLSTLVEKITEEYSELLELDGLHKECFLQLLKGRIFSEPPKNKTNKYRIYDRVQFVAESVNHNFYIPEYTLFLDSVKTEYRKPTAAALKNLGKYCYTSHLKVEELTERNITEFVHYLYSNGKTQSSVRVIFSRIKQYYDFLIQKSILTAVKNPCSSIVFSSITYSPKQKEIIPTWEDVHKIISELPVHIGIIVAISAVKGYSFSQLYELTITQSVLTDKKNNKSIPVTYCWTNDDIWDIFPTPPNPAEENYETSDPFGYKNYYEYSLNPSWYTKLMNEFWNYITSNYQKYNNDMGIGDFFFLNNEINLRSYENIILKTSKRLFEEGKISSPFSLKNIRHLAVIESYNKYHDIKKIQKLLKHTNLNTTRRYMQNIGIQISEKE